MKSNIILENISDGRIYDINDMVKADTNGCQDCSACCHHVGDLVSLNPFDVYEIRQHLDLSLENLLTDKIELRTIDKITIPHLKMHGETERCSFLNEEDRCTIHAHRPSICRLFPLGRVYEEDDFKYFLQVDACTKPRLSKIKVKKWIGIENYKENKDFILSWYKLIKALTFHMKFVHDEKELEEINAYLLNTFYEIPQDQNETFYTLFYKRLPEAKNRLGIL